MQFGIAHQSHQSTGYYQSPGQDPIYYRSAWGPVLTETTNGDVRGATVPGAHASSNVQVDLRVEYNTNQNVVNLYDDKVLIGTYDGSGKFTKTANFNDKNYNVVQQGSRVFIGSTNKTPSFVDYTTVVLDASGGKITKAEIDHRKISTGNPDGKDPFFINSAGMLDFDKNAAQHIATEHGEKLDLVTGNAIRYGYVQGDPAHGSETFNLYNSGTSR